MSLDVLGSRFLDDHECPVCGVALPHELVECVDGHGEDCPDRVCTGCGGVLVTGHVGLGSSPREWYRHSA